MSNWFEELTKQELGNHCCYKCLGNSPRMMMIVCPECGNKRCPKASDHDLKCTNSNESGQPGSVYV